MTKREQLVERLEQRPLRVCRTLHHCCLCDKSITLGEPYYDGGYGSRAHKDCISAKCPRCGADAEGNEDDEAGFGTVWCSRRCGWEVVV